MSAPTVPLHKFLRADLVSPYAEHQWREGEWVDAEGDLVMCENGIHVCRPQDLIHWLDETLWEVETRGEVLDGDNKLCVRGARIVRRVEAWSETSARLFAADCAEDVLHLFETRHPGDTRPRDAIVAARRFARGEIDAEAADSAAHSAAYSAADSASAAGRSASAAARSAADSAGDSASAAGDAAGDSASAAGDAARSAGDAARSAANSAYSVYSAAHSANSADSAYSAANSAYSAYSAAHSAARRWQTARLLGVLGIEVQS